MTNTADKINQTIHEARGLCWHEGEVHYARMLCKKCGVLYSCFDHNPNYTSDWSAWGEALEWAHGEEWWEMFAYTLFEKERRLSSYAYEGHTLFNEDLLNPLKGSFALAEFIDKHPDIFKKEAKDER